VLAIHRLGSATGARRRSSLGSRATCAGPAERGRSPGALRAPAPALPRGLGRRARRAPRARLVDLAREVLLFRYCARLEEQPRERRNKPDLPVVFQTGRRASAQSPAGAPTWRCARPSSDDSSTCPGGRRRPVPLPDAGRARGSPAVVLAARRGGRGRGRELGPVRRRFYREGRLLPEREQGAHRAARQAVLRGAPPRRSPVSTPPATAPSAAPSSRSRRAAARGARGPRRAGSRSARRSPRRPRRCCTTRAGSGTDLGIRRSGASSRSRHEELPPRARLRGPRQTMSSVTRRAKRAGSGAASPRPHALAVEQLAVVGEAPKVASRRGEVPQALDQRMARV
jgi:hypothetical protein